MARPLALLLLALAANATGQTVLESRSFEGEHVVATSPTYFIDIGLTGPTARTHGTVVDVDLALEITANYDMSFRNSTGSAQSFQFWPQTSLTPVSGDCVVYDFIGWGQQFSTTVLDGELAAIQGSATVFGEDAGPQYFTGCGQPWTWDRLYIWHGIVGTAFDLTYGGGANARPLLEAFEIDFELNGTLSVEWEPTPAPTQSICQGSASSPVALFAGGPAENFWIMQDGAPDTFNLLVVSREATAIVPLNGLCVGANGAAILRLNDSLARGGTQYRWEYPSTLSGQTVFVQSWFRVAGGGAATGECIEVALP